MKDYQFERQLGLFGIDKQIRKVIVVVFMQNEIEIKIDDSTLSFWQNPWWSKGNVIKERVNPIALLLICIVCPKRPDTWAARC